MCKITRRIICKKKLYIIYTAKTYLPRYPEGSLNIIYENFL